MNKKTPLLPLIIAVLFSTNALAQSEASGCARKAENIKRQIEYARAHGNAHRVEGLGIALSEVNANCTDSGLRINRESDVRKKELKVEEARQELVEAQMNGRQDKIEKRQRKLSEVQVELEEARAALQE